MKKQTKKALLIGLPLLLGGIIVYSQLRKKTPTPKTPPSPIPSPSTPFENYKVDTLATNLNVRSQPTTTSSMIDSLPKGTVIKARPSTASGWFEYSKDGSTRTGFVSGQYLKKV